MPTFNWTNPDGSRIPLNLRQPLSIANEAQRMARQDDQLGKPGQGIRFDYRATPEIAGMVKDLLAVPVRVGVRDRPGQPFLHAQAR